MLKFTAEAALDIDAHAKCDALGFCGWEESILQYVRKNPGTLQRFAPTLAGCHISTACFLQIYRELGRDPPIERLRKRSTSSLFEMSYVYNQNITDILWARLEKDVKIPVEYLHEMLAMDILPKKWRELCARAFKEWSNCGRWEKHASIARDIAIYGPISVFQLEFLVRTLILYQFPTPPEKLCGDICELIQFTDVRSTFALEVLENHLKLRKNEHDVIPRDIILSTKIIERQQKKLRQTIELAVKWMGLPADVAYILALYM